MINNLCEIFGVKENEVFGLKLRYGGIEGKCRIHNNKLQVPSCYGGFSEYDIKLNNLGFLKVIKYDYCMNCGEDVTGYNYCPNCGTKRGGSDEC